MVDSIARNIDQSAVAHNLLDGVQQSRDVQRSNQEASRTSNESRTREFLDQASISPEAMSKLENEKKVLQFTRIAQRIAPDQNTDKVAHFKDLLDSGRINEYLRSLNTDSLAAEILNSPAGAFLKSS